MSGVAASPSAGKSRQSTRHSVRPLPAFLLETTVRLLFFRARLASAFFQGRSAKPLFGAGPFPIFVLHVLWPPPLMSTCHVFVFLGSAAAWQNKHKMSSGSASEGAMGSEYVGIGT